MLREKYNSIMEKPEKYRNRWALGLSTALSIFILVSFAFYKGYLSFGGGYVVPKSQVANVVSVSSVPSPIQSTGETFKAAFDEINKQYQDFTNSISNVLGPFFTNIEVYQRK